ncbi:fusaric acid resistance protein [Salinisphaera dokdonensis CL-ES53]|uniref:Fusaric acid resistance protein n=2 Tax=Salinisphaera TaxID=180541 RepID=A0ABV2AZ82_9GAMM
MHRLAWLFLPSAESVSFAIRCCVSVALVLYLAFWLQLDNAYWAFINVAILIQPLPGFLVVRAFSRLLGTFVAGVISIVLVALFAQSYVLFCVSLVVWVSLMVFCASLFRNNLSYGFVLAGYVTMIVGVRAMADPDTVFSVAVARTAETGLAAVVAAFVSVLLAPGVTARKYLEARVAAMKAMGRQFRRIGCGPDERDAGQGVGHGDPTAPHPLLHELVSKTLALEQTRQYARYDEPAFSEYDRLARRLDYELLALVSSMASLQVYLGKFGSRVDVGPLRKLDDAAALLARDPNDTGPIKHAFGQAYNAILADARADRGNDARRSLVDWVIISRALDLANRMRAAVIKHGMLLAERGAGTARASRRNEFSAPVSLRESLRTTVRAGTAIAVGAAIWATHNDPALSGMMVLLAVLTTLFALGDNPVAGARGFAIGSVCAFVSAFVANFVLLPAVNGFVMLMVVLLPFVFVAGLAMATPSLALVGRISLVQFALLVNPANGSRQDFITFAEAFMGISLAVILALVAFSLILPVSPRGLLRERLAGMFGELAKGFTGSRERFETRIYDRLLRLPVAADQGETHVSARQAAFSAVNMGLEARSLRVMAGHAGFAAGTQAAVQDLLAELEALFRHGYPAVDDVFSVQTRANTLAQRLLKESLVFTPRRRLRHGVRAGVAAELVAAALADYGMARENADGTRIRLGASDRVV